MMKSLSKRGHIPLKLSKTNFLFRLLWKKNKYKKTSYTKELSTLLVRLVNSNKEELDIEFQIVFLFYPMF